MAQVKVYDFVPIFSICFLLTNYNYQTLYLNSDLMNLCDVIKREDSGFNRHFLLLVLIFQFNWFITIIHESSHWLFFHFQQGDKPENRILPKPITFL